MNYVINFIVTINLYNRSLYDLLLDCRFLLITSILIIYNNVSVGSCNSLTCNFVLLCDYLFFFIFPLVRFWNLILTSYQVNLY